MFYASTKKEVFEKNKISWFVRQRRNFGPK